jgi:hypothetical protein
MPDDAVDARPPVALTTIRDHGTPVQVAVDIRHDGIEFIGRLWFTAGEERAIPDRGQLPGRTEADVLALARALRTEELLPRYRRAVAEKRRFHGLRQLTQEILDQIRYVNQVAVSMRSGLLDTEAAVQEMDLTEKALVELVRQVRVVAGIET